MKKLIILLLLILVSTSWSQTYERPTKVSVSNDGLNSVGITDVGAVKALKVDVIQSVTPTPIVSGTNFYSVKRSDIAAVSVNLAFGFTSKKVVIEIPSSNTDEVCIDWAGGVAVCPAANTSGDDRISAGSIIILDDYAVTSISTIASSGTQSIYVRAYN